MYLALTAMVQKMKLQTKIANKEKKMYAITLWNIFIFNTCFTTYLLLFAIRIAMRIYESFFIFKNLQKIEIK